MDTSRQFRHSCLEHAGLEPENFGVNEVSGRTAFGVPSGTYRHATVNPDGSILFSAKAFSDDIVAFVYWLTHSNPSVSTGTKAHLRRYVVEMDARAVRKHGYEANEAEKNFEWIEKP